MSQKLTPHNEYNGDGMSQLTLDDNSDANSASELALHDNNDSVSELSESYYPTISSERGDSTLYSSGSSAELSKNQYNNASDISTADNLYSRKVDSVKSLWSTEDVSYDASSSGQDEDIKDCKYILSSDASPFVFDGKTIQYNIRRGVDYETPVVFGSRKLTGHKDECGYHPSHFVFDPKSGSLAAGNDVNNGWSKLPRNSLISGSGNSAHLDASFITGSNNKINLELLKGKKCSSKNPSCSIPPACSIIGGSDNDITNTSQCRFSSAVIGCHNINIKNCESTVVLGMIGNDDDFPLEDITEGTFTRDLYATGHIWAGPIDKKYKPPKAASLVVNGDSVMRGDLHATGNIDTDTLTANKLFADNALITNLEVSGSATIPVIDRYIQGTGGITGNNFVILPSDNIDIIYANPIYGTVNIFLGTGTNNMFPTNKQITFKDATLEFGSASPYNVNIMVRGSTGTQPVRIEHYNNGLTAGTNAGYSVNSSGGSVTFRFAQFPIPGSTPTWVIENQFIGNPRLFGTAGFKFPPASECYKSKIITRGS